MGVILSLLALGGVLGPPSLPKDRPLPEPPPPALPAELRILRLQGRAYERGLAHGQALRSEIRQRLEKRLARFAQEEPYGDLRSLIPTARRTLPPEVWDEVRGIAEGAGISLESALLLNLWSPDGGDASGRGALLAFPQNASDAVALALHTRDGESREWLLQVHQASNGLAYAVLGPPGEVGGWVGLNQA
ncbi:MAG: hypothetical protein ACUVXG_13630, partial [Anaerolineae bacterium]